jgi:hypothetical protein
LFSNLLAPAPSARHEHDPRAANMVLRSFPTGNDRLQPLAIPRPKPNSVPFPHPGNSQILQARESPTPIKPLAKDQGRRHEQDAAIAEDEIFARLALEPG